MTKTALISILGTDRVGLVAAITGCLFDLGGNLSDTTFAVLGEGAEFTTLCLFPDDVSLDAVESALAKVDGLRDADISVRPFGLASVHGPSGRISHRITVAGGDRPGLIARLCEVFVQFKANVVRLNAEKTPGPQEDQYAITIDVWIPGERAVSCLATVDSTAGEMGLNCRWEKLG